jgi:hypothetical protein
MMKIINVIVAANSDGYDCDDCDENVDGDDEHDDDAICGL